MDGRINVILCGRAGDGKSSLANMLVQRDIYQDKENKFKIGDNAKAVTERLTVSSNEEFIVYDTVGLGELASGNDAAIKMIRKFFSNGKIPLNYICYVKNRRNLEDDARLFETFKMIFKGGEKNFIIIVTNSGPEWARERENLEAIKETFGDYPVISVDFPCNKNRIYAEIDQEQRRKNLQHLLYELSRLKNNYIKPEVLSPFQVIENDVSKFFNFVPLVGSVYLLTSSGFYYFMTEKKKMAKKRLLNGSLSLVGDVVFLGSAIKAGPAAKPVMKFFETGVKFFF